MVGKIGNVSIIIAAVAFCLWAILGLLLCFPAALTVSAQESPLCPAIEYAAQLLIPISAFFFGVFILSIIFEDYDREDEMRHQIELEKQKIRKQDDDERDWILR